MNDGTYRRLAASILVAHQRADDSGCLCGRLALGESWADHVAEILDLAGALRTLPHSADPPPTRCARCNVPQARHVDDSHPFEPPF